MPRFRTPHVRGRSQTRSLRRAPAPRHAAELPPSATFEWPTGCVSPQSLACARSPPERLVARANGRTESLYHTSCRALPPGPRRNRAARQPWPHLALCTLLLAVPAAVGVAQRAQPSLTLEDAQAIARRESPDLRAGRAAVEAAEARARQGGAFPNPVLAYGFEQTSRDQTRNSQHIAAIEQPLDVFGQRTARRDAARLQVGAARARLDIAQATLDFEVARAFARALSSERQAALAREMAEAFVEARRVSGERLAAGDISGYADRRLQLEAARYAALAAQATLARDSSRLALAALLADSATDSRFGTAGTLPLNARLLDDSDTARATTAVNADSLMRLALQRRAELRAAQYERDAAAAGVVLAERERVPIPILSGGFKTERSQDLIGLRGFVAGVTMPLPFWDRRTSAVAAAEADTRALDAQLALLRRHIAREVQEAIVAQQSVAAQLDELRPRVETDTDAAMRSVRAAYAEGEITLLEWLDAIRAYQEAQSTVAALHAESLVRRAALARAVGAPLPEEGRS